MTGAAAGEGAREGMGGVDPVVMEDPLYEQALACVQQGRWAEADEALGELLARYGGSPALQAVQEALALHLSAERSWGPEARRRVARKSKAPKSKAPKRLSLRMRVLVVANVTLYLLVLLVWLLLQIKRLLG